MIAETLEPLVGVLEHCVMSNVPDPSVASGHRGGKGERRRGHGRRRARPVGCVRREDPARREVPGDHDRWHVQLRAVCRPVPAESRQGDRARGALVRGRPAPRGGAAMGVDPGQRDDAGPHAARDGDGVRGRLDGDATCSTVRSCNPAGRGAAGCARSTASGSRPDRAGRDPRAFRSGGSARTSIPKISSPR